MGNGVEINRSPTPPGTASRRNSLDPIDLLAKRVGWLRVIVGVSVGLLIAGGAAAVYLSTFQTREEASATMREHVNSDGHPSVSKGIGEINIRLTRVETIQSRMEQQQTQTDEKIDRILEQLRQMYRPTFSPGGRRDDP